MAENQKPNSMQTEEGTFEGVEMNWGPLKDRK